MKPGVYHDLRIEDYHNSEGYSKTGLCLFDEAPAIYEYYYLQGERKTRDSSSKRLGKMFHAMMDGSFENEYIIGPTVSKNSNKWKEFVNAHADKTCTQEAEVEKGREMVRKFWQYGPTRELLQDGDYEVSYFWHQNDLLCKCRPDWISKDQRTVVDFKTAANVHHAGFRYDAYQYHYYVSAALTLNGVEAVTGIRPDRYIFLVIQTNAPYLVAAYDATEEEIELGQEFIERNLNGIKHCLASNKWPGLAEEIKPLGLPYRGQKDLERIREAQFELEYMSATNI